MIEMRIKLIFFDEKKVLREMDAANRKALSRGGAFVRTRARSSIRRRKAVSKPGKPPTSRTGLLKKFIFFAYDPSTESVVIGPAKINRQTGAPETLEHGGTTTIVRRRRKGKTTRKRVMIAARPFMQPALDAEQSNIPEQWRGAMNNG